MIFHSLLRQNFFFQMWSIKDRLFSVLMDRFAKQVNPQRILKVWEVGWTQILVNYKSCRGHARTMRSMSNYLARNKTVICFKVKKRILLPSKGKQRIIVFFIGSTYQNILQIFLTNIFSGKSTIFEEEMTNIYLAAIM